MDSSLWKSLSSNSESPDGTAKTMSGDSRVRAWLEDVELLDTCWCNLEQKRTITNSQQQQFLKFVKSKEADYAEIENSKSISNSLPNIYSEVRSVTKYFNLILIII